MTRRPPWTRPPSAIRKVEIHDAWDVKRWWWKGTDGIRETTWPGVYNRSRLPGRNDYFQLPDWDCYSISGKSVTFVMPDEPWNQIEIAGAAWGIARLGSSADQGAVLFDRPKGQERTFHRLASPVRGQAVTFTNVEQETPIGEFGAYYVAPGAEPDGIGKLAYRLSASAEPTQASVREALTFVNGRHPADERATMVAVPAGADPAVAASAARASASSGLPIVHLLIPSDFRDADAGTRRARSTYSWENLPGGLDGIAIDLPALNVTPTHGAYYPAAHPGEGPDLAAAQHAGRQRVGEAGRGAHDVAGPARPHPAEREGPLPESLGRRSRASRRRRSTGPRSAWSSRRARTPSPNTRRIASPRCATTTRTSSRSRRGRGG